MSERNVPRLRVQLAALTLARLFLNSGLRMAYPFLPELARGLGVSLPAVAQLVSLRSFIGVTSPLFGPLSERFGRRLVMIGAMLLFSLGGLVVVLWPTYWALGVTLSAIALAKVIYDPAMQAYLGDVVPYRLRGRAIAVTELAWAGAFFLGVPAISLVMDRQGWQMPFFWLAFFGLGATILLWRALPPAEAHGGRAAGWRATWQVIRREPVIWAAAVYVLLISLANENILIVYGGWMEGNFGLSLTGLGLATGVIGAAEISGELWTGFAVDRFGKRPVIILFGLLTAVMYLLMPRLGLTLTTALITLYVLFFCFETTVVGGVPLLTELVPSARGVVMSVVLAAAGLGRTLGALLGPALWLRVDFELLGLVSAGITLTAVAILTAWVREGSG